MPTNTERYKRLWALSRTVATARDAESFFAEVTGAVSAGNLELADANAVCHSAFSALSVATSNDPVAAATIIPKFLLPLLLEEPEDTPSQVSASIFRLRELLREWIERYPDEKRWDLRHDVLRSACIAAEVNSSLPALWTIGTIGFRSPEVIEVLWRLARRDDKLGDAALSTIASLQVAGNDRAKLITEIRSRMPRRESDAFDFAIQMLPDPSWISSLTKRLTSPEMRFMVGSLLTNIADGAPGDEKLHGTIWSALKEAASESPQRRTELLFGGNIGPRLNTSDVVTTFRAWLAMPQNDNSRYLLYARLEECIRPAQLEGWAIPPTDDVIAVLREDATRNTGAEGHWTTIEHRMKESAWHTAIASRCDGATQWLQDAIEHEVNGYSKHSVMQIAACLVVPALPDSVVQQLGTVVNLERDEEKPQLFPFIGATDVTRSAATRTALDLLLNCGLTLENYVLQSSAEAVGEVASWLLRKGESDVLPELFRRATREFPETARSLAVSALRQLAEDGLLSVESVWPLLAIANDTSLSAYLRARAVDAIGFIGGSESQRAAATPLPTLILASGPESEITHSALTAIVRLGLWRPHREMLLEHLDLRDDNGQLRLDRPGVYLEWQSFILSFLVCQAPEEFAEPAASLIRSGSAPVVHQLLNGLVAAEAEHAPESFRRVADAAVDRIGVTQTRRTAELYVFDVLGKLFPDLLATTKWSKQWNDWMPDARAALADTMGYSPRLNAEAANVAAIGLLTELLEDAAFAVRRAAARAMARIDIKALDRICSEWCRSGQTDLRRRAAEACGWLPPDLSDTLDCALLRRLLVDPEPLVREAAKRSRSDCRRRAWAAQCIARLQVFSTDPNEYVLKSYPYGRALVRLGDDSCMKDLADIMRRRDLSPSIRHWLRQLHKETDTQWSKTTSEWPQPWLPWRGSVEELDGMVKLSEQQLPVHFSLWRRHRETPSATPDWGGAFWLRGADDNWFSVMRAGSDIRISIPGRREATALVANWSSDGAAVISGNGPYPEEVGDEETRIIRDITGHH